MTQKAAWASCFPMWMLYIHKVCIIDEQLAFMKHQFFIMSYRQTAQSLSHGNTLSLLDRTVSKPAFCSRERNYFYFPRLFALQHLWKDRLEWLPSVSLQDRQKCERHMENRLMTGPDLLKFINVSFIPYWASR